jgi:hypothetical protein
MSQKTKTLITLILPFVIVILFFNKLIFRGEIYVTGDFLRSDTLNQNLPFKYELYKSLQKNTLPLWTNTIYSGFPLLAEGEVGALYPPHLILFKFLPFLYGYNFSIILSFAIAFFGTYLLARNFKISNLASLFSAFSFSFSSFFVFHITHQNIIAAASYFPLSLYLNFQFFDTKKIKYLFLSSLVFSLSILAGSPQIAFYSALFIILSVLIFRNRFKLRLKTILVCLTLEFIAALLISSAQVLPTYELTKASIRTSGLGTVALNSLPYHPRNLLTFFYPYIFGDPGKGTYPHFGESWGMFWENSGYIGILPLFFGKYSPLFWIHLLPVFNSFRVTGRYLLPVILYLSIISGLGVDLFLKRNLKKRSWGLAKACFLLLLIVDIFFYGYKYNPTAKFNKIIASPETADFLTSKQGRVFSPLATLTYDEINKDGWRDNANQVLNHKNALDSDINMLWGIKNFDGYSGLFTRRHFDFRNMLFEGFKATENGFQIDDNTLKILGMANVGYLISSKNLPDSSLNKINEFGEGNLKYTIYENPFVLSRGQVIPNYKTLPPSLIFKKESYDRIDLSETVLLENNIFTDSQPEGKVESMVKLISDEPQQVEFNVFSSQKAIFLLQDAYYPGWRAYVNDQETDLYPANAIFRAVKIPEGQSEIVFTYEPKSYKIGIIISVSTLVFCAMIWVYLERRKYLIFR